MGNQASCSADPNHESLNTMKNPTGYPSKKLLTAPLCSQPQLSNLKWPYSILANKPLGIIALLLLLFTACGERRQAKTVSSPSLAERIMKAEVPVFDADSSFRFVEQQVAFGPRVPNTPAHAACAGYLASTLGRFTSEVLVQEGKVRAYDGTILHIKNIIGSFNPEIKSRILLCAHWDSRPYADHDPDPSNHDQPILGANDGASGVGVLLEVARQLSGKLPDIGVDIIFFDAEDYGEPQSMQSRNEDSWALGSQYWSKKPHTANYRARFGILLDMVGAPDAVFTMEGTSMQYAPDIMKKVWDVAHALGHGVYFSRNRTNLIIDDHYYINQITGIPTIDIIHYTPNTQSGFFEHWHTVNDNMDAIDRNTLRVVGETVLTTVYLEK